MQWKKNELSLIENYFIKTWNELTLFKKITEISPHRTYGSVLRKIYEFKENGYDKKPHLKKLRVGYLDIECCVIEDTLILTKEGLKPIQNIKEGELVLTHTNRWQKVIRTSKRLCDGIIYNISNTNVPLLGITPNHPIYTINTPKTNKRNVFDKRLFTSNTFYNPTWTKGKDLTTHNLLISLLPNDADWPDIKQIYLGNKPLSEHHTNNIIPNTINCDDDLLLGIGLFLGNGYCNNKDDTLIQFFPNKKDTEFIEILERFSKKLNFEFIKKDKGKYYNFYVCSKQLADFFIQFYNNEGKKDIPLKWLNLPNNKIDSIIKGLLLSDGHKYKNKICITNTSLPLIQKLLIRLNFTKYSVRTYIRPSKSSFIKGREIKENISYILCIYNEDKKHIKKWNILNQSFHKMECLETKMYDKYVYNLQIEEDESYIANGFISHNSNLNADLGIILSWYIKAKGKNEYYSSCITKKELFEYKFDYRVVKELLEAFQYFDILWVHWGRLRRFDVPFIISRAYKNNLQSLLPKHMEKFVLDTWDIAKNKFKIHSNRLDSIGQLLNIKNIKKTPLNTNTWMLGMYGEEKALEYIYIHNKRDVQLLERIHTKLTYIDNAIISPMRSM